MLRKCLSTLFATVMFFSIITTFQFTSSAQEVDIADTSSYADERWQWTDDGVQQERCTYRAWHEAYDRLGISLPLTWGNAATWAANARRDGYSVDNTPSANSIVCWSGYTWGHVAYVTGVDDNNIYIREAGINPSSSYPNYWFRDTSFSRSNQNRWNGYSLQGYIHLAGNPEPETLKVNVSGSQAYLNWDWDDKATYYNVKLWRNKVWEGDPYRIVWSVKNNKYGFALPKGTYQAYVDACNDNSGYCKMSNVITFTIGDVGVNLNVAIYGSQVTFSWNSDSTPNYSLKVFKEFTWDGELYENIQPLTKTSYTLGLPKGRYQAYVDCNSMSNVVDFTIGEETPKLNANVQGNQVYFNWNADNKANSYNLKIYKGHVWQVDAYETINNITKTTAGVALPSGTYQAYVDAVGNNYLHMGSVIEFAVNDASPALSAKVEGNQVYFSWNSDKNAKKYHLKIYKGHVWLVDAYEKINNITGTTARVALPSGTYQAYLDAEGDDYWHMGNVIQFTVGNSEPVLSAKVTGNQVDFSWTNDNKARSYALKIWSGHAWQGDAYLVKNNIADTKVTVMLPKGNYQAYIDALEENNIVMGNVIDVIITDDNYINPILGDVDGDGEASIIDATYIQRYNVNMQIPITEETLKKCGDVDGDGEVNVIDATFIQRFEAKIPTPYPIGESIT